MTDGAGPVLPTTEASRSREPRRAPAEGGQLVYFAHVDSPVKCALHKCVSLFSLGPAPSFSDQQPRPQQTQRPPNVVPGNKPSGSAVVPRAHSGLEQPSLRPSARQSMSALAPGVVLYFGRFSRAPCPGLCRCSQPSLGDGGMIGRPGNKPSHPRRTSELEGGNKSPRPTRVLQSLASRDVGSRVIPEF